MKILLVSCLAACSAYGSTVAQLPVPANVTGQRVACAAVGFSPSGEIEASCFGLTSTPCSGRGCQPIQHITTYNVLGGIATACKLTTHHLPQVDVIVYQPGFNASNCKSTVANPTGDVVVINSTPYYYVSSGPGGDMLVNSNTAGFVVYP